MADLSKTNTANTDQRPEWLDFHHTAPGTLAGRYMRMFWHPIFHSAELPTAWRQLARAMRIRASSNPSPARRAASAADS